MRPVTIPSFTDGTRSLGTTRKDSARRATRCRDDCRTVVAPAFAAKNFRHLAGTKAKARWNATTTDAPTATDNAKWDPRRVGYYRGRFQEETACLSRG